MNSKLLFLNTFLLAVYLPCTRKLNYFRTQVPIKNSDKIWRSELFYAVTPVLCIFRSNWPDELSHMARCNQKG
jgi:hypothetical protein